jgi:hypothetical protein
MKVANQVQWVEIGGVRELKQTLWPLNARCVKKGFEVVDAQT